MFINPSPVLSLSLVNGDGVLQVTQALVIQELTVKTAMHHKQL